jgi:pimeloyl-ACP methyl ester carboxylesterase
MPYAWLKDGTPLHYIEQGEGRPLVLLHALMFSARWFWKPNIPALAKSCRAIALDMRGQGESGKPNFGYSIAGLADDLREFLAQKQLEGAVIAGVALGGLVLLSYLQRFGNERIKAISIVDMTPRLVSAPGWAHPTFGEFPQAAAEAFGAQVRKDRSGLKGFIQTGFADPPSETVLDEAYAESFLTPTDAIAELVDDMVRQDFRDFLPQIRLPTLLLYGGSRNKILPTGVGRWMAQQIPGSRYVEFEKSGHMLFLEESGKFNAELAKFVRELE